jgi:cysteine synthase
MNTSKAQRPKNDLRDRILSAAETIANSTDLSPANTAFHDARYSLYEIAARDDVDTVKASSDEGIRAAACRIFPVSCKAGILEECAKAKELLARKNLTFGDVYLSYYGDVYQALMQDELDYLSKNINLNVHKSVYYIGGGAMPVPALLLARLGFKVTIVDPHAESCDLAFALAERVGLSDNINIVQTGGETASYAEADLVWIANWILHKEPIFHRIRQFNNVQYVIARSAAENSLSFIINDQIDDCAVCKSGYALAFKTQKRKDLSLVSLLFKTTVKAEKTRRTTRMIDNVTDLIGDTPLLRLDPGKTGLKNIDVFAKLEHMNPFGSIKDRTAHAMLSPHIKKLAQDGKKVLELSSGNAARALQAIAGMHGTELETVSSRIRLAETRKLLQIQGAKVTSINHLVDPTDAYSALNIVDRKAQEESGQYFYTDQYRNPANVGAHLETTGKEILEDLGHVDFFVGSIGTAGSSVGIVKCLREKNPTIDVTGVVSDSEDFIPGIRHYGEIFNVGPYNEDFYSRIQGVTSAQAIDGVLDLVRLYGVMAGPSSGANYHAALSHLRAVDASLTKRKTAVFIVCDRLEPYISYIEERRPDLFAQ